MDMCLLAQQTYRFVQRNLLTVVAVCACQNLFIHEVVWVGRMGLRTTRKMEIWAFLQKTVLWVHPKIICSFRVLCCQNSDMVDWLYILQLTSGSPCGDRWSKWALVLQSRWFRCFADGENTQVGRLQFASQCAKCSNLSSQIEEFAFDVYWELTTPKIQISFAILTMFDERKISKYKNMVSAFFRCHSMINCNRCSMTCMRVWSSPPICQRVDLIDKGSKISLGVLCLIAVIRWCLIAFCWIQSTHIGFA